MIWRTRSRASHANDGRPSGAVVPVRHVVAVAGILVGAAACAILVTMFGKALKEALGW